GKLQPSRTASVMPAGGNSTRITRLSIFRQWLSASRHCLRRSRFQTQPGSGMWTTGWELGPVNCSVTLAGEVSTLLVSADEALPGWPLLGVPGLGLLAGLGWLRSGPCSKG